MKNKKSLQGALQRYLKEAKKMPKARKAADADVSVKPPRPTTTLFRWPDGSRSRSIFCSHMPVITVGDGDFGFSAALQRLGVQVLAATTYDAMQELEQKYPATLQANLSILKDVRVVDQVDARKYNFQKLLDAETTCMVVWNFPHGNHRLSDQGYALRSSQRLLLDFFCNASLISRPQCRDLDYAALLPKTASTSQSTDSCPTVFVPKEGGSEETSGFLSDNDSDCGSRKPVVVGKMPRQGVIVVVTLWSGEPYDSWNIKKLAATAGWACHSSFGFDPSLFPGYRHVATKRLLDPHAKASLCQSSRTYIFVRSLAKPHDGQ